MGLPVPGSLQENGVSANGGGGGVAPDLLDLADIFGGAAPVVAPGTSPVPTGNGSGIGGAPAASGGVDLLADIFANTTTLTPSAGAVAALSPSASSVLPAAIPSVVPSVVPLVVPAASDAFGGFEKVPPREETIVVSLVGGRGTQVYVGS